MYRNTYVEIDTNVIENSIADTDSDVEEENTIVGIADSNDDDIQVDLNNDTNEDQEEP